MSSKNFLALSFNPTKKFLFANWLRPVNSTEYRHGIRMIALSITTLRVQFSLTDFSKVGALPLQDQTCTANFLKKALTNTSLQRCARIIPTDLGPMHAYEQVMRSAQDLPYQVNAFTCVNAAQEWLFENTSTLPVCAQHLCDISLDTNMHFLRGLMQQIVAVKTNIGRTAGHESMNDATDGSLVIISETDYMRISVDCCNSMISLRWLKPVNSTEFRCGVQKVGQLIREQYLEKFMVNNQNLGVLSVQDQSWVMQQMCNIITETNLSRIAVVSSENTLQQMVTETIDRKIQQNSKLYEPAYFFTEDEAIEWLLLKHQPNQV